MENNVTTVEKNQGRWQGGGAGGLIPNANFFYFSYHDFDVVGYTTLA